MESMISCPLCGEQVLIEIEPYDNPISSFMKELTSGIAEKTEHFKGLKTCKCGKTITLSLFITAV